LLLVCAAPRARALPCNTPELLFTLPREGATGVATNATLVAGYASSTDYLGEEVLLIPATGDPLPLPATFDRAQRRLTVQPEGLTPGAVYSVRWPGLRGVDTASPGIGREVRFTVGAGPDVEPPRFDGVGAIRWEWVRARNNCNDELEDRFVFDLELGQAADDGGREALALRLFQRSGASTEPVLLRPLPAGTARLEVPASLAVGQVCFSAQVEDLTGKTSDARSESCIETVAPPFFRGCAAGGSGAGGLPLVAVAWAAARWRRRRG
jgi:hypothetical protein